MDYCNSSEKKYCNIYDWQDKGYTGKGIKVAFIDEMISDERDFITIPFFKYPEHFSHGDRTIDVFHQIAPDAKVYLLNKCPTENIEGYDVDWIINEGISIINVSMTGAWFTPEEEKELCERGVTIVSSAGNDGDMGEDPWLVNDDIISVAAVHYNDGDLELGDYSSWGSGYVDCAGFSHIYMSDYFEFDREKRDGTSYSSPWVAGMIALYQQWFKEQHNRTPDYKEIRHFVFSNCVDLGDPGKDLKYGNGLFVLPLDSLSESKEEEEKEEPKETIKEKILYDVQVYGMLDIKEKLEKDGYEVIEVEFDDGFSYKVVSVMKTNDAAEAVALRNELKRKDYVSKIQQYNVEEE